MSFSARELQTLTLWAAERTGKMWRTIGAYVGAATAVIGAFMFVSPNDQLSISTNIFWFAVSAVVAFLGWRLYRFCTTSEEE
ncbi:MAG: hypothetical protein CMI53_05045 [Parcubacteria group bacterium]|nr:hypothetical protein [Parcubacteria group bacterium]